MISESVQHLRGEITYVAGSMIGLCILLDATQPEIADFCAIVLVQLFTFDDSEDKKSVKAMKEYSLITKTHQNIFAGQICRQQRVMSECL